MNLAAFGPHAGFILAAYGASGFIVAALVLRAVRDDRALKRALAALEPDGAASFGGARPGPAAATGDFDA